MCLPTMRRKKLYLINNGKILLKLTFINVSSEYKLCTTVNFDRFKSKTQTT